MTEYRDFEDTPESLGAMAALAAKAERQGVTQFFRDPIHVRRDLMRKGSAAGWHTPIGYTISTLIEQLQNLYGYERPAWATDERQTLPYQINKSVERVARLSQ